MPTPRTYLLAVIAIVLISAACSDDPVATTTTTTAAAGTAVSSPDDVVFGSGVMPDTIPSEFPIPQGSVLGSTMVVTKTGFTEVIIRLSAEIGVAAEFFNQGLEQAGFTVESSVAEADGGWRIEFLDGDTPATIELTQSQAGISQAVLRYNVP